MEAAKQEDGDNCARQCTRLLPLFKPKACNCKCQATHFAVRTHDTFGRSRRASRNADATRSAFALPHCASVRAFITCTNARIYIHVYVCVCVCVFVCVCARASTYVYLYATMTKTPWKSDSLTTTTTLIVAYPLSIRFSPLQIRRWVFLGFRKETRDTRASSFNFARLFTVRRESVARECIDRVKEDEVNAYQDADTKARSVRFQRTSELMRKESKLVSL